MLIAFVPGEICLVKVVCENRVERRDISCHAGHERRQQCGKRQAQHAGGAVFLHKRENHAVVVVFRNAVVETLPNPRVAVSVLRGGGDERGNSLAIRFLAKSLIDCLHTGIGLGRIGGFHGGDCLVIGFSRNHRRRDAITFFRYRCQRHGDHARNNHKERNEHFRDRTHQGRVAGGRHVPGGHGTLDDEEIRTPVAEAQYETETKDYRKQIHAHWVVRRTRQQRLPRAGPGVCTVFGAPRRRRLACITVQRGVHRVPTADIFQPKVNHWRKAEHDHEELQHFCIDRRCQSALQDIE